MEQLHEALLTIVKKEVRSLIFEAIKMGANQTIASQHELLIEAQDPVIKRYKTRVKKNHPWVTGYKHPGKRRGRPPKKNPGDDAYNEGTKRFCQNPECKTHAERLKFNPDEMFEYEGMLFCTGKCKEKYMES